MDLQVLTAEDGSQQQPRALFRTPARHEAEFASFVSGLATVRPEEPEDAKRSASAEFPGQTAATAGSRDPDEGPPERPPSVGGDLLQPRAVRRQPSASLLTGQPGPRPRPVPGASYRSRLGEQLFGEGLCAHRLPPLPASALSPCCRPPLFRSAPDSGVSEVHSDGDKFLIFLDVKHFFPEDLVVKVLGDFVEIHGKHHERQVGGWQWAAGGGRPQRAAGSSRQWTEGRGSSPARGLWEPVSPSSLGESLAADTSASERHGRGHSLDAAAVPPAGDLELARRAALAGMLETLHNAPQARPLGARGGKGSGGSGRPGGPHRRGRAAGLLPCRWSARQDHGLSALGGKGSGDGRPQELVEELESDRRRGWPTHPRPDAPASLPRRAGRCPAGPAEQGGREPARQEMSEPDGVGAFPWG
ncbi:PREDICTED: alpha-crystallin A chain [Condylura cristata]|uniref:alpha-crystallin A chain n=1 Tax=Condylura cristata TaxID=143302 RepID=UPI000642DAF8|nr:PREDICTED: alpha-crystallin A chain [Condylura cristata]